MKIIVYNSKDQYALSRKQIQTVMEILPKEYFIPIREFHITHSKRGAEQFEYLCKERQAHFCYPVTQKSPEDVSKALTELLIGLIRIKNNTKWGYPLPESERIIYSEFVKQWHSKCISAFHMSPQ